MAGEGVAVEDSGAARWDRAAPPEAGGGEPLQLVTFCLGSQTYGVDIMVVREIKVWTETTPLPNTPPFVRGVINLRGVIVPVFDLRERFGQGRTEVTKTHVVVVVAVDTRIVGILVDAVSDILTVPKDAVRPVPDGDHTQDASFLSGLIAVGDSMVAMISPARLFSRDVVSGVSALRA